MRKNILISILGILFCITPVFVFATSGSCSWHNGVSCSSGADWDGSVICNDGWKDSSVDFFDSEGCLSKISCNLSQRKELELKYGTKEKREELWAVTEEVEKIKQEASNLEQELIDLLGINETTGMPNIYIKGEKSIIQRQYNSKIASKYQEASIILQQAKMKGEILDDIEDIINETCKWIGYDNEQQKMNDRFQQHTNNTLEEIKRQNSIQEELRIKLQEELNKEKPICPQNATYLNEKCFCNTGYSYYKNSCMTYTEICKIYYNDNNMHGFLKDNGKMGCGCDNGYKLNSIGETCDKVNVNNQTELIETIKAKQQASLIKENKNINEEQKEEIEIKEDKNLDESIKFEEQKIQEKKNNIIEKEEGILKKIVKKIILFFKEFFKK